MIIERERVDYSDDLYKYRREERQQYDENIDAERKARIEEDPELTEQARQKGLEDLEKLKKKLDDKLKKNRPS